MMEVVSAILARGRRGFEAYAADDYSLGLFPSPRKAAAAITTTRPWVAQTTAEDRPERGAEKAEEAAMFNVGRRAPTGQSTRIICPGISAKTPLRSI